MHWFRFWVSVATGARLLQGRAVRPFLEILNVLQVGDVLVALLVLFAAPSTEPSFWINFKASLANFSLAEIAWFRSFLAELTRSP